MPTVRGRVLLGWMSRDEAVRFLMNDCEFDPPLGEAGAEALWAPYRAAVDALPARAQQIPRNLGLTPIEAGHAAQFERFLNARGPHDVLGVQKVDLRELTAIQYYVVLDKSTAYAAQAQSTHAWLQEFLPTAARNSQVQFRFQQMGLSTYTEVDLPHGEFLFSPDNTGRFGPVEMLRHVTAMTGQDRMWLTAGYHRSFAKVFTAPAATVPSAVVAVARNTLISPTVPTAAPGVAMGIAIDPLCPFGAKAAKLGDFLTNGLFIDVDLRKKRFQLQVHANWVALDDPT